MEGGMALTPRNRCEAENHAKIWTGFVMRLFTYVVDPVDRTRIGPMKDVYKQCTRARWIFIREHVCIIIPSQRYYHSPSYCFPSSSYPPISETSLLFSTLWLAQANPKLMDPESMNRFISCTTTSPLLTRLFPGSEKNRRLCCKHISSPIPPKQSTSLWEESPNLSMLGVLRRLRKPKQPRQWRTLT